MTIKITQLGNLTGVYGNTIIPVVANIAGDWTTVKGNLTQFSAYTNLAELPYGNIIPAADAVYSLGTASYRFKDLYLLGTTIYLGNATISVSNAAIQSSLPITASSVNASNLNVTGSISVNSISVTDSVSVSNITATGTIAATDVTTTGTITAAEVSTANITATGEITAPTLTVSGNTISLGSATLDVSSGSLESTIPIVAPITSTSNLTLQGAAINFAQGSYIEESEVVGQPGTYGLALNSPDDGIVAMNALDANADVTSSVIASNVAVQLNVANVNPGAGNVNVWFFDSVGGVFFPDGTRQDTAYDLATAYSNVEVAAYLDDAGITSYGNTEVSTYLPSYSGTIGNILVVNPSNVSVFSPVYVGFSSDITFANVIISGTNDVNGYSQLNVQNKNTFGNLVSADFIATAPNGTDSTNYIDMGINGNNYSQASWTISGANDGYLYINGGNLTLGTDTPNKTVKVHTGGLLANNVVTTFAANGVSIHGNLFVSNVYIPSLANSTGTVGQITYDSGYVYICVATNTWKRANIATW